MDQKDPGGNFLPDQSNRVGWQSYGTIGGGEDRAAEGIKAADESSASRMAGLYFPSHLLKNGSGFWSSCILRGVRTTCRWLFV
jgi:hypothetical protein